MNQLTKLYIMASMFMVSVKDRVKDRKGQTMVEYALLLALIAIVVIVVVTLIGTRACTKYSQVGSALQ